ncbi:InlB B-repeat-containing protein [Breznakia pachnodae]|uniref:Repeat protein (TIGR02543 family) n=1 Tax=Breznakia pachnodae TaxID=265178 RepID=A0ABU0DYW4_9FIRM|nr:InlB B-repeat-containing protein [Breznakia pachnodae]MDQ0359833.1 putative repeat protein (TIGR02543 family) [Breznakia pachnodae]
MKKITRAVLVLLLTISSGIQVVSAAGDDLAITAKGDIVFNSAESEYELYKDDTTTEYDSNYEVTMNLDDFWQEVYSYVDLINNDPSRDLDKLHFEGNRTFSFVVELDPSLEVDETKLYAGFESTMNNSYPQFMEIFDYCDFYYYDVDHVIYVDLGISINKTGPEMEALFNQGKAPVDLSVTFPEGSIYFPADKFVEGQKITTTISDCRYEMNVIYNNEAMLGVVEKTLPMREASYIMSTPTATTKYTVDFDSRGGSAVASITDIASGSTVSEPAEPIKSDNTFGGWYIDTTYTTKWNFTSDVVIADTTLYAKWIPDTVPQTYKVDFDSQGGSAVASITDIASGSTISEPTQPTKSNNTFDGWYTNTAYTTAWDFSSDVVIADTTLYAKWTPDTVPQAYRVDFDSQGGSAVASITDIASGSTISKPTNPTKSNHTFEGWYTDTTYTTAWNFSNDVVTKDITLYAKWKETKVVDPTDPTPPTNPSKPETPSNPSKVPEKNKVTIINPSNTKSSVNTNGGVNTMDTTNTGLLYLLLIGAITITVSIRKKKYN